MYDCFTQNIWIWVKICDIHNELACVSVQFWEESTPQKTNWFVIPKIIQKMGEKIIH